MSTVKEQVAPTTTRRPDLSHRVSDALARPDLAAGLALAGLLLFAYVAWFFAGRRIEAPWIMGDELLYSDMAKSFQAVGHYEFRDVPYDLKTIYPALVSPAWIADSIPTAYGLAKAINLALMSTVVVPVYLWTRRLTSPPFALLAVALVLLMPSFVFSAEVMTENGFFPAFVLAAYLLARALERPTLLNQALVLGGVALAASVRLQGVVLVAIVPAAVVLKLSFDFAADRPADRGAYVRRWLRSFWPILSVTIVAALGYAVYKLSRGDPLASGLGAYQAIGSVDYSVRDTLRWAVFHLAELAFSVAVIPFSALIVLIGLAVRRGSSTAAERAFLAVTVAAVPLVVIQVGAFASRFSLRIEERNMFFLAPLLLIALVVWLARGAPRPQVLATVAAVVPIGLLAVLPLESLFNVSLVTDTFGLVPLYRLSTDLAGGQADVRVLLGLGAVAAGALFAATPRRRALPVLAGAVAVFLFFSSLAVLAMARKQSIAARTSTGASDPAWVDNAVGQDARVGYVNTQNLSGNPHILWQTEFWNRSVGPVLNLSGPFITLGDHARVDRSNGRIAPDSPSDARDTDVRYEVADKSMDIAGTLVAETPVLRLWKVEHPLRLGSYTQGIDPDGWMSSSAGITEYASPGAEPARIAVDLSRAGLAAAGPAKVTITLGPFGLGPNGERLITRVTARKTVTVDTEHKLVVRLPTPKPPYRVYLTVDKTYDASQLGQGDIRQLGVRVSFRHLKR